MRGIWKSWYCEYTLLDNKFSKSERLKKYGGGCEYKNSIRNEFNKKREDKDGGAGNIDLIRN